MKFLMVGSVIFQKHSHPEPPSIFAASYSEGSTFCSADKKIRICTPEYQSTMIIFPKSSPMEFAIFVGKKASKAFITACVFIAGMVDAPSLTSMFITGPLTMMTGRKNISLKNPFILILPLSIIAMISANTTMMGTSTMVCQM